MLELLQLTAEITEIIIRTPIQDLVQLQIIQVAGPIIIAIHVPLPIIIHTTEVILIAAQTQIITQLLLLIIPDRITVGLVVRAEHITQEVAAEVTIIQVAVVVAEVEVISTLEAVAVEAVALGQVAQEVVEEVAPVVVAQVDVLVVALLVQEDADNINKSNN
jgi:hypothetical protein